ncbi:MAG TPA: FAD-dependent monooxygenase [Gemmatimonadaceae bacterium]|nr:FAD-dependent monooxygenase [Gemmatimonadaceae bacterium]
MKRHAEAIVVGAGPAGSAAAYFLAASGHDVLLLERAAFPRDKPCAEYLSPEAARILDAMGALADVEASELARLRGMAIRSPSGVEAVGAFRAETGYRGYREYGLALRRTVLDAILARRAVAAGAALQERSYVSDLLQESDTVTGVVVRSGDSKYVLRADVVIGADGLRSVTARRSGLGSQGHWPRRMALVTHYQRVAEMRPLGEMHVRRWGYVGLAPVGGDVVNVAAVFPARRMPGLPGAKAKFLEQCLEEVPGLGVRFSRAERVGPVLAVGPFNWHARRAVRPGLALVGDACDFFDPFTGEGIFTALSGGQLLAEHVHDALRAPNATARYGALLDYDRARRRRFSGKRRLERAIGVTVALPPLMNFVLRALALRPKLADLLVGVCGDFIPAGAVLRPRYLVDLLAGGLAGEPLPPPPTSSLADPLGHRGALSERPPN